MTAGCVGAAAGCLGTWYEMSHAVVCVPVVTLPPLALNHHLAVGSTVFGVAARQVLAATLHALEPGGSVTLDDLAEIIDLNTAAVLSASGTVTALGAAAFSARMAQRSLRKANGLFMVALALFLQWRDTKIRAAQEEDEAAAQEHLAAQPAVSEQLAAHLADRALIAQKLAESSGSMRLIILGSASGAVLGFFGIGPAWLLAPLLTHTAPAGQQTLGARQASRSSIGPAAVDHKDEDSGLSASDHRTRSTACFAMVPPSIAAAWRHYQFGHVKNVSSVALPLAAGAVLGSAVAGSQLADVPCEEEFRYAVSILLFAHGCWSFWRP